MPPTFRIFDLPQLALKHILDQAGPHVLVSLAYCSKRSQNSISHYRGPSKNCDLTLDPSKMSLVIESTFQSLIIVETYEGAKSEKDILVTIDESDKTTVRILKRDPIQGLKEASIFVTEIFNRPIFGLFIAPDIENPVTWVNWIFQVQQALQKFLIFLGETQKSEANLILSNCNVSRELFFYSYAPFEFPKPRSFFMDSFHVTAGIGITLEHLVLMDCRKIVLNESDLNEKEMNQFLKMWKNGECARRIKEFRICAEDTLNYEEILEGLGSVRRAKKVKRKFINYYGKEETIPRGIDIRRDTDEAMATIIKNPKNPKNLHIVFWPDWEDNQYS